MLAVILGNQTAVDILYYLQKNKSGYPNEMARSINKPLNMVQKQLNKFEAGGILLSRFEKRKKIYEWNRENPFYKPLLQLLKVGSKKTPQLLHRDPAFGLHLSLKDRVYLADRLKKRAEKLNPFSRGKPFVKTFNTLNEYEKWRQKQTSPWLI